MTIGLAESFVLDPAYPNPFIPGTEIRFVVQESKPVKMTLLDGLGRPPRVLYDGTPAANKSVVVRIDGAGLSGGLYMVRLTGERIRGTQRIALLK